MSNNLDVISILLDFKVLFMNELNGALKEKTAVSRKQAREMVADCYDRSIKRIAKKGKGVK